MAIDIHVLPRPLPRVDLYFDSTRVTRSFATFGGSYAPAIIYLHNIIIIVSKCLVLEAMILPLVFCIDTSIHDCIVV